jgi:hypothetical protein
MLQTPLRPVLNPTRQMIPRFTSVNHCVNACADLVRIGVDGGKVLPLDWPPFDSSKCPAKTAPVNPQKLRLACTGQTDTKKGVKRFARSIAIARSRGDDYCVSSPVWLRA